ncbi:MAG: UDP-N-acetylmuramoyl-L-alanine--D-glutamate ligase [Candidatus Liberibacter europaeus]|uniref:UDP-N-acetylmuramoylalanine--D-glutamate ligase n=1 Tax=Candidatus Liberibacter europaeus TaxID=744859 RepID=A0A2T4VWN5_9HYPH|nr:UDP-N-acetylmuramoyl-L-alanine--D-glutamate ligase [Candidatus Liberibacter europaeus]PTL86160.1 MAG: UDP-N-acetylmuramoyl-L-alanine--D-glutamate ligase [Candidatus Liberibacter europaeus]
MKIRGLKNHLIAVLGLGDSGLAVANALMNSSVRVIAWDDNPLSILKARNIGITIADFRQVQWSKVSSLVLSPGIYSTGDKAHWCVKLARQFNVEIIGDIELFVRERRISSSNSPFVAITGTNGKSTTSALIAHILNKSGRDVQLGGNIGNPVMKLADFADDRFYIIECSSYQIETAPTIDPSIGVLLNVSPDHLDRHHTLDNYARIKKNLVTMSQNAIVCINDSICEKIASDMIASGRKITRIFHYPIISDGDIYIDGSYIKLSPTNDILLDLSQKNYEYNIQNVAASIAVCLKLGLEKTDIANAISSFRGLTHRRQKIARLGKSVFINDSKATNIHAVVDAFLGEQRMIHWIAGGLSKSNDLSIISPFLSQITKAYFIGDSADLFAYKLKSKLDFELSKTLDKAVLSASRHVSNTNIPTVILFSPGCASFDQYKDFRERGFAFMSHVSEIKGIEMLVDIEEERLFKW